MTDTDDRSYYAARAEAERALARQSTDPAASAVHRTLAAEYERRAAGAVPHRLMAVGEGNSQRI